MAQAQVEESVECFDLGRIARLLKDFPPGSRDYDMLAQIARSADASGRLAVQSRPLPEVMDGRLYASVGAMQLSPRTRAFVLAPEFALYDMVNAFPCLLRAEFRRKGIQCEALDSYCDDRDAIIANIVKGNRRVPAFAVKRAFIVAMHFGDPAKYVHFKKVAELVRFKREVQAAIRLLLSDPEFHAFAEDQSEAVCVSHLLQNRERLVVTRMLQLLAQKCVTSSRVHDAFIAACLARRDLDEAQAQVSRELGCKIEFRSGPHRALDTAVLPAVPEGKHLVLITAEILNSLRLDPEDDDPKLLEQLDKLRRDGRFVFGILSKHSMVDSDGEWLSCTNLRKGLGTDPFVFLDKRFVFKNVDGVQRQSPWHYYPGCIVMTTAFCKRDLTDWEQNAAQLVLVQPGNLVSRLACLRKRESAAAGPSASRCVFLLPEPNTSYGIAND